MGAIIENKKDASYRDRIATMDATGARRWVYAKKPKGTLTNYRRIFAYMLIFMLVTVPFVHINGEPLMLFNVIERKFIILGAHFWPQDFHLLFLAIITTFVSIILFTVVFGRLWCGWACPQTIFMEFIYRDLEFLIEGTPAQQKKLSAQVWNTEKIIKRGGKNFLFYLIAFGISNVFLSYIIGSDQLLKIITDDPTNHIAGLSTMLIFSAVFYFVFAFFREQVCSLVCPYGRLQGVLLDSNTIVVAYDYKRGEPRGPYRANENRAEATKGDCISCTRCVQVCPTGIDVRNGTQLECINCSACIDECDSVMTSIGKPKGLIRYDSENGIAAGSKLKITPRNLAYTVVLGVLITVFLTLLLTKSDIDAVILRTYNTIYQEQPNGRYSNMYNYKIFNKSNQDLPVDLKLLSHKGEIQLVGNNKLLIPKQDFREGVIFVILDKESVKPEVDIVIGVYSQGKLIEKSKLTFLGPK